jgi:glycerol-3-phosphate O-acyltransferase 3/4
MTTVGMVSLAAVLSGPWKLWLQEKAVSLVNMMFLFSWCAVIVEKGDIPPREPGQIYVANHSSVVDICFLLKRQKYSITGQKHTGVIGFFQNNILNPLGCLWFNRMEQKDRELVSLRIKEHSMDLTKPPLLVFPEGTCVNNEYVVMFKRGAFELGKSIVPVAIKYNKVFVDPYWNSRETSFVGHLFRLMTVSVMHTLSDRPIRRGSGSIPFLTMSHVR